LTLPQCLCCSNSQQSTLPRIILPPQWAKQPLAGPTPSSLPVSEISNLPSAIQRSVAHRPGSVAPKRIFPPPPSCRPVAQRRRSGKYHCQRPPLDLPLSCADRLQTFICLQTTAFVPILLFSKHDAMSQYIHVPFAVALLIAVGWTTLFSFSNKPGIRGFRNLGILASYILVLVFLLIAGWRAALVTWAMFGVAGGVVYVCWEILQRLRASGEQRPGVSLSPLVHGLFAWPIMVPEAVEYALAELGILRAPPASPTKGIAEPDAAPDSRPPQQSPSSPQVQSSDSQRTPSSGGGG